MKFVVRNQISNLGTKLFILMKYSDDLKLKHHINLSRFKKTKMSLFNLQPRCTVKLG